MSRTFGLFFVATLGLATAHGVGLTAGGGQTGSAPRRPVAPAVPAATTNPSAAVVGKYCVTCHSEKLKTGGLSLEGLDSAHVSTSAETWEKVIRKVRTGAMPPAGAPRPDAASVDAMATYLETQLDSASVATPEPGKLPHLHRLTRYEYANAVRDLLALDALPKDMDYSVLLPADNASSGFDNIADLLFVSPSIMERYLDAARKISRLAVGDTSVPMLVSTYRTSGTRPQDARLEELPFGTRGGMAIHSEIPLDGEYLISIEPSGTARDTQQIEISVDGVRAHVFTVGAPAAAGGRGGRGAAPAATVDDGRAPVGDAVRPPLEADDEPGIAVQDTGTPAPAPAGRGAGRQGRGGGGGGRAGGGGRGGGRNLEARIPIKAGPHIIGVTFVEREARDESTVRPRMRGRGTQPAIGAVTLSGPYTGSRVGDTPSRQRLFVCHPASAAEETSCAKKVLLTLTRHAYRRPVSESDLQDLMPFYQSGRAEGGFDTGIQRAVERLLVSPQFLFRIEQDPPRAAGGSVFRVSDLELASRLSFFIWSSIPDEELLGVAEHGRLHEPAVLAQQVKRMLADERAESLVNNFASQWLFLRDVDGKRPDELLFPDYDDTLRDAFRRETELFLDSVLRSPQSVMTLLTANYTFLNERLARHYGIPQVKGAHFRKVTFPADSPRGGLLGQGSILTLTSYATRTSPVLRGKWILDNVLATPPPPPPPNVPALKVEHDNKPVSIREALEQHRANPVCASCHSRMDPLGFAMENFDAVGRWREFESVGHKVNASGALPDGRKFQGVAELKRLLVEHPEQFVQTITEKLLMYGLGRNVQYYDAPSVRRIVHDSARKGYTFESLVLGVAQSAPFQMRKVQPAQATGQRAGL